MRIAVLMTCHNRRETTTRCLKGLLSQVNDGFQIFVVDDGSIDGTREELEKLADEHRLRILTGDGRLFWAKGMAMAWATSLEESWDGWLLLNDDTLLRDDAIARLQKTVSAHPDMVVVGNLRDEVTGSRICGLADDGTFTGNFVFVPVGVYRRVGALCGAFHHAWADCDYAMRCRRQGVRIVELDDVGTTRSHQMRPRLDKMNLRARWKTLWDPKGWCVHDVWLYRRRNWGVIVAFVSCAHLVLHVLFGGRSNG